MSDRSIAGGTEHTGTRQGEDIYERLRVLEDSLNRAPWTRGRLLDTESSASSIVGGGLTFAAGVPRSIPHGLGRRARGWIEIYLPAVPSAAHCGLRPTAFPAGFSSEKHITVTAASSGTCAILVW